MTRGFLAAMLKRATVGMIPRRSIEQEISDAYKLGVDRARAAAAREIEHADKRLKKLSDETDSLRSMFGIGYYSEETERKRIAEQFGDFRKLAAQREAMQRHVSNAKIAAQKTISVIDSMWEKICAHE